ncbi:hypothetical protein Tco_0390507 [Tanacetum coccineum]
MSYENLKEKCVHIKQGDCDPLLLTQSWDKDNMGTINTQVWFEQKDGSTLRRILSIHRKKLWSLRNKYILHVLARITAFSLNTKNDRFRNPPHVNLKKQDTSDSICVNSNDCMSSDNLCVSNAVNVVKSRAKSKKRKSKKVSWKPTGKVFTQIGYIWRPTGRTFTIVGNTCPLTRITTTNEVPSRKPIVLDSESPKPVVKLVYSRKPRKNTNAESVSKTKVLKPMSANKQEPSKSWGSTKTNIPSTSLNECRSSKSSYGTWIPVARST